MTNYHKKARVANSMNYLRSGYQSIFIIEDRQSHRKRVIGLANRTTGLYFDITKHVAIVLGLRYYIPYLIFRGSCSELLSEIHTQIWHFTVEYLD